LINGSQKLPLRGIEMHKAQAQQQLTQRFVRRFYSIIIVLTNNSITSARR